MPASRLICETRNPNLRFAGHFELAKRDLIEDRSRILFDLHYRTSLTAPSLAQTDAKFFHLTIIRIAATKDRLKIGTV